MKTSPSMIAQKKNLAPVEEFKPWAYEFRRGILGAQSLEEVQGLAMILVAMVERCEDEIEGAGIDPVEWLPFETLKGTGRRSVMSGLRHPSYYLGTPEA